MVVHLLPVLRWLSATHKLLVTKAQSGAVSEALEDADDCANGNGGEEGFVLDNLRDLILGLLGFGLVVDLALLDVLCGGLGGLGIGLRCGGRIEGVAVEEILQKRLALVHTLGRQCTYVGNGAKKLNGSKHVGGVEEERERRNNSR